MIPPPFAFTLGRPFAPLYGAAMRIREACYRSGLLASYQFEVPVISVGNLTLGGSGKTPLVQYLARLLQANGRRPAVISRGYGGRAQGRVNVVSDGKQLLLDAGMAGDEPRLLAETLPGAPVLTGIVRRLPAARAVEMGADVLLLDDGYQHLQIRRDINLALFNADRLAGNSRVFPGGDLREPVAALRRATAFVFTGVEAGNQVRAERFAELLRARFGDMPVYCTGYAPRGLVRFDEREGLAAPELLSAGVHSWFGFCGIARPESFQRTLEQQGLSLAGFLPLNDHQRYTPTLLNRLLEQARLAGAQGLITTEKDLVKLASLRAQLTLPCYALRMQVSADPGFDAAILQALATWLPAASAA